MDQVKLFGLPAEKGRWFLIPLGMTILLCLGTVYSWSIFRKPLQALFKKEGINITATESLLPFTVLLVVFAVVMPIAGFYINRFGARLIIAVGGLIMATGYILSSFASNINMLVFTYGIIAGIGVGMAYGMPLAVVARWFPDKKGIAVGLTVVGFGLSPLITAPLAKSLISTYQVRQTFTIFGVAFALIILVASLAFTLPPTGWKPANWNPPALNNSHRTSSNRESMIQSRTFYGLWLCYAIGSFAGLAAIGIASPLAQEIIKLDEAAAASSVSLFAIFNGAGRPFFGWLTDKLTPKLGAIVAFVLVIIASIMMLSARQGEVATYLVAFSLFYFSLGGWLAIAPTSTLTFFNPQDYAKNYGIVFTAYGVGALGGTLIAGQIRDIFGSYTNFFYPTAALAVFGIILAVFLLKPSSVNISEESQVRENRY
jgi:MFS transporter, OFA family, oxalate/formate antiporter